MSNDRLENILLIKINSPVLGKTHNDFDNILVSQAIDLYFEKNGDETYVLQAIKVLEKLRNPCLVHQSKK